MKAINVTQNDLKQALNEVNKKYNNNIEFETLEPISSKSMKFTLRVKSSKAPGHRRGFSGRRMAKACWHVHGNFFEEIFKINPSSYIRSLDLKITKDYGNWQDRNVGSQVQPLMFSEACDCSN